MIIDLSVPRMFIKDKIDETIFELKMKGLYLNKQQISAVITTVIILGFNRNALAYDGVFEADDFIKKDIYSLIFATVETLKTCTIRDLNGMLSYLRGKL